MTGGCLPCPEGAHCPGASRAWPLPNYWSANEYVAPTLCPVVTPLTCLGTPLIGATKTVDADSAVSSGGGADAANATAWLTAKDTQRCAAGYTGRLCAECVAGHFKQDALCLACPAAAEINGTLFAAVAVIALMSLAVGLLPSARLGTAVMLFVLLQRAAAIGSAGASSLGSVPLATFFAYLNLINFNVEGQRTEKKKIKRTRKVARLADKRDEVCE